MSSPMHRIAARGTTGIALSESELHIPGAGHWSLPTASIGSDEWRDAVSAALREARMRIAGGQELPKLAVAVLPSAAPLRIIPLPKMRQADLDAVLARGAARYFPAVRDRQMIAALRITPNNAPQARYAVVAVSALLLREIERAAATSGWSINRFVPAYAAWAVAGERLRQHKQRGTTIVIIPRADGGAELLHVERGVPHELRRRRAEDPERHETPLGATRIESPEETAARFAPHVSTLELQTEEILARRKRHQRMLRTVGAAAAVLLLIAGSGAYWWQVRQTLHETVAQRERLKPQVERAAQLEAKLNQVALPAQSLARVEEHGARWSAVLNDLATSLPPDAYLESVRASLDTITVEGAAQIGSAAGGARVFQSVAASNMLTGVAPVGSIRRDAPVGINAGDPLERFTLTARVANAARLVPPPQKGKRP